MPRQNLSVTIPEEDMDHIEGMWGDDAEFDTRSGTVEHLLREGMRVSELEAEIERLKARNRELEQQLNAVREREDDVQELANFAEQRKTIQERRAQAGIGTRLKWAVFGMDLDEEDE